MKIESDLSLIRRYQKELFLLGQTNALLGWDEQTYMPKKAAKSRAEQHAFLKTLIHEKLTSEEFFNAIKRLNQEKLEKREEIIVKKLYKEISKSKKLPAKFVEELARETSTAFNKWIEAREKSDFSIFEPYLKKVVELKRQQTKYYDFPGHPYNSLIDNFEEGMTMEKLQPIFKKLKIQLIELLKKIEESEAYKNQEKKFRNKSYDKQPQIELVQELVKTLGLSEENFRVDFAEHPFTTRIGSNDVRITTNTREDLFFSFSSSLHEIGHALYELNLPDSEEYTVLWDSPSYGLHESQSRFWENQVGLSEAFWRYFFPKFDEKFKLEGDFENWYKDINFIHPGKIRIESDEIHYCLHIILRFEIEAELIKGTIKVKDLPEIWNQKMKEYFNIIPNNDKEGVLQDVHWSNGYFGYFPSYALGTIYSAQLYNEMKKQIPNIEGDIFKGDFKRINKWLNQNIHIHGAKMFAEEVIKEICKEGLNPDIYIDYLTKKYSKIYNL